MLFGTITVLIPASIAASTLLLTPPIGNTFPLTSKDPVIEKLCFTGMFSNAEITATAIEIDAESSRMPKAKVQIRPFVVEDFTDIKPVLDSLRAGYTVGLINIRALKDKDLVELKRVINKLKKTCDAIEGDIAGFGEDYVVAVPYFARIHRNKVESLPE